MVGALKNLKKLRGRSLYEIRVRGAQGLAMLRERWLGSAELTDRQLLQAVRPASRNGSGEGTARLIVERIKTSAVQTFFPSFAHRAEIAALMAHRFPAERRAIIERADRVVAGKFDLLGHCGLDFGNPIDWRLEPLSGKRTPLVHWSRIDFLNPEIAGDKKVTWELNRHQFFVILGQAYWMTGDERYAESFVAQATSWMDANPPGLGINWASSLEVAFRAISWLWALHLFAGSDRLTPAFAKRLLKFLAASGRHVETYLSRYFSPNTHLTGEALGLFYLGVALPELSRAEVWRATGLRILHDQLYTQIRGDGVYFEQTTYYHRYTADFYTHLLVLARASRIALPPEVEPMLAQMLDHLMWIKRPDGTSPLLGDDDGGRLVMLGVRRANDFRDTLATGAAIAGRGDWKFVAGEAAAETLWLLGPEGLARYDEIKAEVPREHTRAFAESGYFVLRDGWSPESGYALIDCGPHGSLACGHAHADALSLEFSAAGEQWLTDAGTFNYTGSRQWRDYFRSTAAHNTAVVDGQSQSVPVGPFSWGHIAECRAGEFITGESFAYFEGSHNGYQRLADPVTHTREVLFVKSGAETPLPPYLLVRDHFSARLHHRYALHHHFAPGCQVAARGSRIEARAPGGSGLTITAFGTAEARASATQGWISRCYGQCQPAPAAVISAEGKGEQSFATLILPSGAKQLINVSQQAVSPLGEGGFSILLGDALDVVLVGDQASRLNSGSLSASGKLAWARFAAGRPVRAGLFQGQMLEIGGRLRFQSQIVIGYCTIEIQKDWMELVVRGASQFGLTLNAPVGRLVINGSSFVLDRRTSRVAFEDHGMGWKMKLAQLGAA